VVLVESRVVETEGKFYKEFKVTIPAQSSPENQGFSDRQLLLSEYVIMFSISVGNFVATKV
jgi:hypothetical protein